MFLLDGVLGVNSPVPSKGISISLEARQSFFTSELVIFIFLMCFYCLKIALVLLFNTPINEMQKGTGKSTVNCLSTVTLRIAQRASHGGTFFTGEMCVGKVFLNYAGRPINIMVFLGKTYDVSPYDSQRSHPSMDLGVKWDLCVLFVQTAVNCQDCKFV